MTKLYKKSIVESDLDAEDILELKHVKPDTDFPKPETETGEFKGSPTIDLSPESNGYKNTFGLTRVLTILQHVGDLKRFAQRCLDLEREQLEQKIERAQDEFVEEPEADSTHIPF